jgi:inner membrane transporter RhtA
VVLAGIGIVLLTPIGGLDLDVTGIVFALLAGACWATYILLSARTGRVLPGGNGLAIAMTIGAIGLLPFGAATASPALANPQLLLMGFGVAMLSSAVPYSLELEALRHLPVRVFGVLLSLEPMVAAIAGFLILGETLNPRAIVAIVLVTLAAAGSSRYSSASSA